jgi:hypothetical protein
MDTTKSDQLFTDTLFTDLTEEEAETVSGGYCYGYRYYRPVAYYYRPYRYRWWYCC